VALAYAFHLDPRVVWDMGGEWIEAMGSWLQELADKTRG